MSKATFPEIDYTFWFENYSWEDFSSMVGMITTMKNKNYIDEKINRENITNEIKSKIELFIKTENDSELFEIFKLIQTWGGKSVGNYTLDIVKNWNTPIKVDENVTTSYFNNYKNFVDKLLNNEEIDSFYYLLNERKIRGLSNSFIPKHICFWSGNGDRTKGYPILDDVIANLVYDTRSAKNVSYKLFIDDISNFADNKHLSMAQVEMALFAFSGYYWKTRKTGTNEFKIKNIQNHKDFEEAIRISNR